MPADLDAGLLIMEKTFWIILTKTYNSSFFSKKEFALCSKQTNKTFLLLTLILI
jgi:hypothetical protein